MIQIKSRTKLFLADDTTIIIEIHPQEIALLNAMRNKFRFGQMQITLRDGLPVRIDSAVEGIDLTKPLDSI